MTDYRFTEVDPRGARLKERRPYDECPHCGKFKYTKFKQDVGILFSDVREYHKCKNCEYRSDK